MTIRERVEELIQSRTQWRWCDGCIAAALELESRHARLTIGTITRSLERRAGARVVRARSFCNRCGKHRTVTWAL